jgi:hypothetical protein
MSAKKKYVAVWRDRLFIGPVELCEPGTLRDCRKAIAEKVRADRWKGSRFAALWPSKPVHSLKSGDGVDIHIGRNGYHLWARYYIEPAR